MALIRGTVVWGQIPLWFSGYEMMNQQVSFNGAYLVSANTPMIYQILWNAPVSASLPEVNEMYVPAANTDVVNVIFNVYATTKFPTPSASLSDWTLLGRVKKSRDIPNTNVVDGGTAIGQRFTVDISRMVADQLSYSLVPIGKGSWQNQEYGGMNGGVQKQDNVTEAISPYNVTENGTYRAITVTATIEMLNSLGEVVTSTTTISQSPVVRAINSVPNFDDNIYYDQMRIINQNEPTQTSPRRALTNCPNVTYNASTPAFMKSVNIYSQADFLYFYVKNIYPAADSNEFYNRYEVYGQAYEADGTAGIAFVLGSSWKNSLGTVGIFSDISHSFQKQSALSFKQDQNQVCVQNVSVGYINDNAYNPHLTDYPYGGVNNPSVNPIVDDTSYFKVYVRGIYWDGSAFQTQRHSSTYWYSINREDNSNKFKKQLFQNVTFHWLNSQGGIDTYVARRDIMESITAEKSLMETKLPNRRYMQDDADTSGAIAAGDYYSDTMRGFDTYRGGTEVLSVSAKIKESVYTEPLGDIEARWLREIFASPNVWIEDDSAFNNETDYLADAPYHMRQMNPTLRPQNIIYKPIIITNSEVVSLDQAKGLVQYNIEYTHSQGVLTQRN